MLSWFSTHPLKPDLAAHGIVRTAEWTLTSVSLEDDNLTVTLEWANDTYQLQYTIQFGSSLDLSMTIWNRSSEAINYEIALHTYFQISDIDQIRIKGLEAIGFVDQLTQEWKPAATVILTSKRRQTGSIKASPIPYCLKMMASLDK